jgi:ApbE superfamily uncharacterized protein (UPF0280 family)
MKTNKYQKRFYRDRVSAKDLYQTGIAVKETDLQILTDKPINREFCLKKINLYRQQIEDYIAKDQKFLTSLKPIAVELKAPKIIKKMAQASNMANVGPMASVAGAIAEFLGRDLLNKGYKEVIIENGGDIFLKITRMRKIGIYSGKSKLWQGLSLKIEPKNTPLGICTSSGTIGHSLSFGYADSAVILSKNATLADAVATATANRVQSKNDLFSAVDFAKSIRGISGIVIVIKNNLVSWGKIEFSRLSRHFVH